MEAEKMIQTGWIIVGISVIIGLLAVGIFAPDVELVSDCDDQLALMGSSSEECENIFAEDEFAAAVMGMTCVLPSAIGGGLVLFGKNKIKLNGNRLEVIQNPVYMMPAQPTYASPAIQQHIQNDLDAQIKQQRMQNVELLRANGRLMEAALEAEQASEFTYAAELRSQAEDKLRNSHKPQTNNENTYLAYLTSALADGFLSLQEEQLLETQRNLLQISWETHSNMLSSAGYSHENLKLLQSAKTLEDSGRFIESAALYETAGNLDRAQMLRMKAKMLDSNPSSVTYNISDSAVSGNIGSNNLDDLL